MVTPLRAILKSVTQSLKLEPAITLARAQRAWPKVVGSTVAAASMPIRIKGERLTVGTTHPAVGQEIKLRHDEVVAALGRELDGAAVTAITVVHRRTLAPPSRRAKRRD